MILIFLSVLYSWKRVILELLKTMKFRRWSTLSNTISDFGVFVDWAIFWYSHFYWFDRRDFLCFGHDFWRRD